MRRTTSGTSTTSSIHDAEVDSASALIHQLHEAGADALIVQDMGILELDLPPIQLHASTQTDIRHPEKARFLQDVGFSQIVLAREMKWYVSSGGRAQTSAGDGVLDTLPPRGAVADTFTYNPGDPTPYLIDSRELEESLNEDYTKLNATRRDALVFTSKPLTKPLEVTGEMTATIWAASDAKDTDWAVMLLDVFPDGHAERVQDGFVRARFRKGMDKVVPLVKGQIEQYEIDLWFTSKVFAPGHRLRVSITSALFPKYNRNLNTGGNNEKESIFVSAHQRLIHDAAHPSHIVLPVIPR